MRRHRSGLKSRQRLSKRIARTKQWLQNQVQKTFKKNKNENLMPTTSVESKPSTSTGLVEPFKIDFNFTSQEPINNSDSGSLTNFSSLTTVIAFSQRGAVIRDPSPDSPLEIEVSDDSLPKDTQSNLAELTDFNLRAFNEQEPEPTLEKILRYLDSDKRK